MDNRVSIIMESRSQNEAFARLAAAAFAAPLDPTVSELADIKTAVSEAVTNAIIHGYGHPNGKVYIDLALEDRLLYAYDLYQLGKSDKILVSGDHGQDNYDEVNVMKNYLAELGVPREMIFQDHAGFNTYDL